MKATLPFAFSPCPNDTFAFDALVHRRFETPFNVAPHLHDIDELNKRALEGIYPLTKVSAYCLGKITKEYCMLPVGAAIGEDGGPKLIARNRDCNIQQAIVAVPGDFTTAALLLKLLIDKPKKIISLPYHEILPAILQGRCDAGVIIHETRFTFHLHGLKEIEDLGDLFQERFHCPIPLGVIAAKRTLGDQTLTHLTDALQQSVAFAKANPTVSVDYVIANSQEKNREVIAKHIDLYVTENTQSVSKRAMNAIRVLFQAAIEKELLEPSALDFL
ncbi:MAG: 1,4-dihydroxy-6-naphthoate synthase [Chlamydiia bacterium]|nr:1,4-dihydroxy-6-naphthoate synthase [Chlamydiia bacterium]